MVGASIVVTPRQNRERKFESLGSAEKKYSKRKSEKELEGPPMGGPRGRPAPSDENRCSVGGHARRDTADETYLKQNLRARSRGGIRRLVCLQTKVKTTVQWKWTLGKPWATQ